MQARTQSEGFGTSIGTIALASAIGTTIEWYDFFLFGVVTPIVLNKPWLICLYVLVVSMISALSVYAMTEAHKRDMAVDNK